MPQIVEFVDEEGNNPKLFASNLKRPTPLKKGDTIFAIAPSGAISNPQSFYNSVKVLEARGYKVIYRPDITSHWDYYAGTVERRVAEMEEALGNPNVAAIWAVRGGSGAEQILPKLRGNKRLGNLPWLIGYSDITALHALWNKNKTESLHGCIMLELDVWDPRSMKELWAHLESPQPIQSLFPGPVQKFDGTPDKVSGRVWGGNLTVLAALCGTGEMPDNMGDDTLLFFEDVGEEPYRLDRCLTTLAEAGALRKAKGVIIGQIYKCDKDDLPYTSIQMLLLTLKRYNVPCIYGLEIGHNDKTSRSIVLGVQATIDFQTGLLIVGP